jgi:hypothetical protein
MFFTKIITDTFFTLSFIFLFFSKEFHEFIPLTLVLFILLGIITGVYRSIYRYSNFLI